MAETDDLLRLIVSLNARLINIVTLFDDLVVKMKRYTEEYRELSTEQKVTIMNEMKEIVSTIEDNIHHATEQQ
jgi:hypothetical protein